MTTTCESPPKTNAIFSKCARCGRRRRADKLRDGLCDDTYHACWRQQDNELLAQRRREHEQQATRDRHERISAAIGQLAGEERGIGRTLADGRRCYFHDHHGHRAIVSADGQKTSLHLSDLDPAQVEAIVAVVTKDHLNEHAIAALESILETGSIELDDARAVELVVKGDVNAGDILKIHDAHIDLESVPDLVDAAQRLVRVYPAPDDIFTEAGKSNQAMRVLGWQLCDILESFRRTLA